MNARRFVAKLPEPLVAYPFQVVLTFMLMLSSFSILFGLGRTPRALTESAPFGVLPYYWSITTFVGSILILVGMHLGFKAKSVLQLKNGHRVEILGLILQGFAALVYAVALFFISGTQGIVSGSMLLTIGLIDLLKIAILQASSITIVQAIKDSVRDEDDR